MSIEFKIIVRGISLSYEKNNSFGFLFPVDECHTLMLRTSDDDPGISLAGPEILRPSDEFPGVAPAGPIRRVSIYLTDPVQTSVEINAHDSYDQFLDMTHGANGDDDHLHFGGINMRNGWERCGVLVRMQHAVYGAGRVSRKRFMVMNSNFLEGGFEPAKNPDYIGLTGLAKLTSMDGGALVVKVETLKNGVYETTFNHEFKEGTTIILDNDCDTETGDIEGDFHMLYWIVEDADVPETQYTVMREILPNQVTSFIPNTKNDAEANPSSMFSVLGTGFSGKFTNSFGMFGLPCHKVRASKPDNLPDLDF